MNEMQERLARLGLDALGEYGFALAGGYALQAHRLVDRVSEDIDMFTDSWDPERFADAVNAVSEAFRHHGFVVEVTRQAETFARIQVTDRTSGHAASVDLGADYRAHQPVVLSVGPVLEESDSVASKVATVFSRALARDYLDLAGILQSGRYTKDRLLELGASVDAGFTEGRFAEALAAIDRFEDQDFERYGFQGARLEQALQTVRDWSRELRVPVDEEEARQGRSPETGRPSPAPPVLPPSTRNRHRPQTPPRYGSWPSQMDLGIHPPSRGPQLDL